MAEPGDRGRHRRGSRWWQRGPYWSSHRRGDLPERPADRAADRAADRTAEWPQARRAPWEAPWETQRETQRETPWEAQRDTAWGADWPDWPGWPPERPVERVGTVTAPVADDRPQYVWQDFELDDLPTRAAPHPPDAPDLRDGRRHCGPLERILHREWDAAEGPPSADAVRAVDSLARLPEQLKTKLAIGLEGIYVGRGGVPDLDDMGYLRGAPLPSGRATWDICAAYPRTATARSWWGTGRRPRPT